MTPILQYGAVPVFVDVTVPQYNIDVTKLEGALSEKTKAVMIAHTLGNPFDLKAVKAFCNKYNLWLIEDNCDALGTEYTIDGETLWLLFSGNLIKHPCFDAIRGTDAYHVADNLDTTDFIMNHTFWVGVYPGMTDTMIDYMAEIIREAVNEITKG